METVFIYIPTRLLPTSSKQQQLAFFYLLKILYIANIVFLFLKIYSVLWNKQKPVQNHLLSKLAFYDHLVFTKKQKNAETASNKTLYMLKIELDSLDNLKK